MTSVYAEINPKRGCISKKPLPFENILYLQGGGMAVPMDILGELDKRGIVEAVEKVIGFSNFQSALQVPVLTQHSCELFHSFHLH